MASTIEIDLVVKINGRVLPGAEIHYRSTRDEVAVFDREQDDAVYADLQEEGSFGVVNDLLLRTDSDNTLIRLDGQTTGQINLNANGLVLILNGLVDDAGGNLVRVQYNPGNGTTAGISGFIAGT